MTHRLVTCLAIAALIFAVPRPAAAAIATHTFDTVDAVEITNLPIVVSGNKIIVTGILLGQTTPTTLTFAFNNNSTSDVNVPAQCERLAVIAMSKPGKYQFAISTNNYPSASTQGGCKLIRKP